MYSDLTLFKQSSFKISVLRDRLYKDIKQSYKNIKIVSDNFLVKKIKKMNIKRIFKLSDKLFLN